jgi:transcriptional regulator with XRE-family HTH domain
MDEQGRSASWLARKCGVSQQFVSFILKGDRTASHELASKVADVLGVPLFLLWVTTDAVESAVVVSSQEKVA